MVTWAPLKVMLMSLWSKKHNKLFKSDSQRVAFLLYVAFSV